MKKLLLGLGLAVASLSIYSALAAETQKLSGPAKVESNNTETQIILYQNPDIKSPVVAQLSWRHRMIPFYQQDEWVKVGLPQNGQVGWVNIPQYVKAREQFYRSRMQDVYIQVKRTDDKSKPTIIAYKNGEKLSDAEAEKLYQQMQAEHQQRMKNLRFRNSFFEPGFDDFGFGPPVVIFQNNAAEKTSSK